MPKRYGLTDLLTLIVGVCLPVLDAISCEFPRLYFRVSVLLAIAVHSLRGFDWRRGAERRRRLVLRAVRSEAGDLADRHDDRRTAFLTQMMEP